jgi:hypothetical protein
MLSRSSFKAELEKFRAALCERPHRPSVDMDLLARWLAADDAEQLWKTISSTKPPAILPRDLIDAVIKERRQAQSQANRIYGAANVRGGHPERFFGFHDEWNAIRKKKLSAEVLAAANELYLRAYDLLADEFKLSRQDDGNTRVLRLFWQKIGSYLQSKCGRWFDVEVARLTEIAFDLPTGSVSPTSISDARKERAKKAH